MKQQESLKIIKIVALVTALSLLGDSMLYIVLPLYWEQAGLDSLWQVGVLLSINRFVRLPIAPFVGWLYKRISLRTGLLIATGIGALATLGYGVFNGFIAWLILRSIWGIAWSFFRIGGLASVAFYAEGNQYGKAMGTYNGLSRLGSLFGMLLGGIFVPIIGLKSVAIIFGAFILLGIPFLLFYLEKGETTTVVNKVTKGSVALKFDQPHMKYTIILICISGFFVTLLLQGVLMSTLSSIIEFHYGEFISVFQFVISAALLSGFIQSARWIWEPFLATKIGMWSDGKMGRIPLFVISTTCTGLVFCLISLDTNLFMWIVITIFVLLGATAITTLLDTIAIDHAGKSGVTFITAYTIIQDVGAACGPFLSYFLIELDAGYIYLYWGGTIIFLFISMLWLAFYLKSTKYRERRTVY